MTITLESSDADTYLYLREGHARSGAHLYENNDHDGSTSRSQIVEELAATTYTVEATTWGGRETGNFTLTVAGLGTASRSLAGGRRSIPVVESPSVSKSSLRSGESFTLSVSVRNQGDDAMASTSLRYYRSTNSAISTSDTVVGRDEVGSLVRRTEQSPVHYPDRPDAGGDILLRCLCSPRAGVSRTRRTTARTV